MTTTVLHGDNLELMKLAQRNRFDCQFVYMDPPFFTQKVHKMADGQVAFDDKWPGIHSYVQYLEERAMEAWRLLTPNGCMVVHVDPKTSHYVKVMLDGVFGSACFASEIIWRYRRWPSKTRNLQRVHDVLLRYVKAPANKPTFNQLYEPLAPSTKAAWGTRKQMAVVQDGKRVRTSLTDEESPGVPLGDVWDDIGIIAPSAKERTGYPTQKPEKLLERLLLAFTNPGDMVLDPYCGSGTTLAVAQRLGRNAVGIDRSLLAVHETEDRITQQSL